MPTFFAVSKWHVSRTGKPRLSRKRSSKPSRPTFAATRDPFFWNQETKTTGWMENTWEFHDVSCFHLFDIAHTWAWPWRESDAQAYIFPNISEHSDTNHSFCITVSHLLEQPSNWGDSHHYTHGWAVGFPPTCLSVQTARNGSMYGSGVPTVFWSPVEDVLHHWSEYFDPTNLIWGKYEKCSSRRLVLSLKIGSLVLSNWIGSREIWLNHSLDSSFFPPLFMMTIPFEEQYHNKCVRITQNNPIWGTEHMCVPTNVSFCG